MGNACPPNICLATFPHPSNKSQLRLACQATWHVTHPKWRQRGTVWKRMPWIDEDPKSDTLISFPQEGGLLIKPNYQSKCGNFSGSHEIYMELWWPFFSQVSIAFALSRRFESSTSYQMEGRGPGMYQWIHVYRSVGCIILIYFECFG